MWQGEVLFRQGWWVSLPTNTYDDAFRWANNRIQAEAQTANPPRGYRVRETAAIVDRVDTAVIDAECEKCHQPVTPGLRWHFDCMPLEAWD